MSGDILADVRALAPTLRAQAAEAEQNRAPTPSAIQHLKQAKLLSMLLPKQRGGRDLALVEYARVLIEVARGDLSIGWVVHVLNGNHLAVRSRSEATQAILLGGDANIISGGVLPVGRAREVAGGYVVEGIWHNCTAVRFTDWVFGGVLVVDKAGQTQPGLGFAYMPTADIFVRESWFAVGLMGTGSDSFVAKGIHVPAARMILPNSSGTVCKHGPLFIPAVVRAGFLALLLGGAMTVHELTQQATRAKVRQSSVALAQLSKAAAQIETARLVLLEILEKLDEVRDAGAELAPDDRASHEVRAAHIVELIHGAVEASMFIAGSSALMHANPLSRYWRDMHVGLRHLSTPHVAHEVADLDGVLSFPHVV